MKECIDLCTRIQSRDVFCFVVIVVMTCVSYARIKKETDARKFRSSEKEAFIGSTSPELWAHLNEEKSRRAAG